MAKKTSIGGWAYIWGGYSEAPIPLEQVVKELAGLGFDGIEMAAFPPHLEPNTKEKRLEIKKLLDSYGLGISGLAAPFPSPSTSKESDYLDAVKANLEDAYGALEENAAINSAKLASDTPFLLAKPFNCSTVSRIFS